MSSKNRSQGILALVLKARKEIRARQEKNASSEKASRGMDVGRRSEAKGDNTTPTQEQKKRQASWKDTATKTPSAPKNLNPSTSKQRTIAPFTPAETPNLDESSRSDLDGPGPQ